MATTCLPLRSRYMPTETESSAVMMIERTAERQPLTPPPSPPQALSLSTPNINLPNPFITPKIERNSWNDPFRGMDPQIRMNINSCNKGHILAHFRMVVDFQLHHYNRSRSGNAICLSNSEEDLDMFGQYKLPTLHSVWQQLHYRFDLMALTDRICIYLRLSILPPIQETHVRLFKMSEGFKNEWSVDMVQYATQLVEKNEIFPKPSSEQGTTFKKPAQYLGIVLGSLKKGTIDAKVKMLVKLKHEADMECGWKEVSEREQAKEVKSPWKS